MYEQQYNPYGSNAAIVKEYFKGGKILALGIMYIVSALLGFVTVVSAPSSSTDYYYLLSSVLNEFNVSMPSDVTRMMNSFSSMNMVIDIVSAVLIPVLTAVAFILIFSMSRSASETTTPRAGLTIMYVLAIISLVSTILLVVAVSIVYLMAVSAVFKYTGSSSRYNSGIRASFIFIGVVLIAVFVFAIAFAVVRKNFYRSARRSITSVNLENNGAIAYGVFNIIYAVGFGVYMLYYFARYSIVIGSSSYARSVFSNNTTSIAVFTLVLQMVLIIFTAVVAIGYGKHINRHIRSYNPPYGGTPYGGGYNNGYNAGGYNGGYGNGYNAGYPNYQNNGYNNAPYPQDGYQNQNNYEPDNRTAGTYDDDFTTYH